jgi:hypothetical protein
MSEKLVAVAAVAAAGWPPLPLRGKVPITPPGHLDATIDADQFARWFRPPSTASIGARVPDALVVTDIDRAQVDCLLARLEDSHSWLPLSLTVR